MTKFSIAMGVGRREPVRRIQEIASTLESYGFHALWLQDNPLVTKDPYIALALAAVATSKLVLAPGVSTPVIRHPSVIVNSICTLDSVAEGRVVLGLGSGGRPLVDPLGCGPTPIDAFRQTLLDIGGLLKGDTVAGQGSARYKVNSAGRPAPIYVAANGPRMLSIAGEAADGAIIAYDGDSPELSDKIMTFRQSASRAGKGALQSRVNVILTVEITREDSPPENAAAGTPHYGVATTGTREQCLDRLLPVLALKPDEVTFRLMTGGRMERLRQLADLAEALRKAIA